MTTDGQTQFQWTRTFWIAAAAILALRIATLMITPLGLGPDETQYWVWSRHFDFGYFSKPPIIAWAIALTTGLFGNADWAARLSAPLFHVGSAAFLFLTARRLFGERAAFWAGLSWLLMPGVILSSFIIATDAPLLFFWSAALFFLTRITEAENTSAPDFAGLGAMIGLGMMSKYAMIYFPIALVLMLALPGIRRRLLKPHLVLTVLVAVAVFLPNMLWNAANDFQTVSHTAANADWDDGLFKPLHLIEFLSGQFAVFGVIFFAALIYIGARWRRLNECQIMLLIATLTPLVIVAGQAFLSRAHANWAAAAYPAATLLVTGFLLDQRQAFWVKANAALHAALFAGFTVAVTAPGLIDRLGFSRVVEDLRGWEAQTDVVMAYAPGYDAVVIDDRYLMGEMLYHQPDSPVDFAALSPTPVIDTYYEITMPFDPQRMKRVLFVTTRDDDAHVHYRFHDIKRLGSVDDGSGNEKRRYALFELSGYFGPGATKNAD